MSHSQNQIQNQVIIVGGQLSQPPQFTNDNQRPTLRLHLAMEDVAFFQVVAYNDLALLLYPRLQVGMRLLVYGFLQAHPRNGTISNAKAMMPKIIASGIVLPCQCRTDDAAPSIGIQARTYNETGSASDNNNALNKVTRLTPAERRVIWLLSNGLSGKEIASELRIAYNTMAYHRRNIYSKLDVHSRDDAVAAALHLGLV